MPRYVFTSRGPTGLMIDGEARELSGDAAAHAYALALARDTVGEVVNAEGVLDLSDVITITDETGVVVGRIPFIDAVTIRGWHGEDGHSHYED